MAPRPRPPRGGGGGRGAVRPAGTDRGPLPPRTQPRLPTSCARRSSRATLLFAAGHAATLFAWYGLGTWLPKLMGSPTPRFDLGRNPLTFLLALNLGAVAGSAVTAWARDPVRPAAQSRSPPRPSAPSRLAVPLTYPTSVTADLRPAHPRRCRHARHPVPDHLRRSRRHYPPTLRGTSLGSSLGGGRVGAVIAPAVAGWLLALNPTSATSSIVLFAAASGLGAVLLVAVSVITRPRTAPAVESAVEATRVLVH